MIGRIVNVIVNDRSHGDHVKGVALLIGRRRAELKSIAFPVALADREPVLPDPDPDEPLRPLKFIAAAAIRSKASIPKRLADAKQTCTHPI